MALSPIIRIENAIKTAIAADFTSGYSGLNLSNKVVVGEVTEPPTDDDDDESGDDLAVPGEE